MGTTSLGLVEPSQGTDPWYTQITANWALIDSLIATIQGKQTTDEANITSILTHQGTDESAITASQVAIAAIQATSYPIWHSYTVTISGGNWMVNGVSAGALTTSLTSQLVTLFTTPANMVYHAVALKTSTAFGGTVGSCVASVGSTSIPDAFMMATGDFYNLVTGVSNQNFYIAGGAKALDFGTTAFVLQVVITGAGDFVSGLTTGVLKVSVLTSVVP
jgi:hypothetical protein